MDLSTVLPASVVDLSKRSNIVTIFCAIPELGSVFPVNIDIAHSFIGDLKRKIKEAKPHTICFDADMLRLYLAKSDGMWLNSNDDDVRALKRGEVRERVGNLMLERLLLVENEKLNHDAYFGNQFEPTTRDVHVLIDIPEDCNFPGRNNTITISCAIPGAGSVFRVHIDNRQRVGDLKNKIKEAKPNLIRYDADLLKLYLAKNRGGWLSLRDDNTSALLRREVRDGVKDLMKDDLLLFCDLKLNHNTVFGKRFSPVDRDIHVLVKEAEDPTIVRHYKSKFSCWLLGFTILAN
ncbi:hypothetical protein P3T76_002673 [Phytophthora citrophthora]|uniref:Crinkler effector protein N-terminal domain-containing protein n=1 Tax=Phytophthora citrophthora TaxID=4793 RepID=A0AAD9GVD4_9STRA|nr:hypothetical protein P3T76_002673 [Phytophthora citrophthora]